MSGSMMKRVSRRVIRGWLVTENAGKGLYNEL